MGNTNAALLYRACRQGDVGTVRTELKKGANPNPVHEDKLPHGWGPLHVAANYNHMEVCKVLLQRGADINAKDKAVSNGIYGHTHQLIMVQAGRTPLDLACNRGSKEELQQVSHAPALSLLIPCASGGTKF